LKTLYKGNLSYLYFLLLRLAPLRLIWVFLFKVLFILFQVSAISLIVSWYRGHIPDLLVTWIAVPTESNVYPGVSASLLVFASFCSLLARKLSLSSILKVEKYIEERIGETLKPSTYKSIVKVLLSMIDLLVPLVFIAAVSIVWLVLYPVSLVPVLFFVFIFVLVMKRTALISIGVMKKDGGRSDAEYISSGEHDKFFRILMLPQYLNFAIYLLMAALIFVLAVFIKNYFVYSHQLMILSIVTALAVLRLKSFLGIIVRIGAYYRSIADTVKLLKQKKIVDVNDGVAS
jgi:hypothetical protein